MLQESDYASTNPYIVQMISIRSEVILRIKEEGVNVNDFCASAKISTSTFYRMERKQYVSPEAWGSVVNHFGSVIPYEEYCYYGDRYQQCRYLAFSEEGIRSRLVKKPSKLITATLRTIKTKAFSLFTKELMAWLLSRSQYYREKTENIGITKLEKDKDVTSDNIEKLVLQHLKWLYDDFIHVLDKRRL